MTTSSSGDKDVFAIDSHARSSKSEEDSASNASDIDDDPCSVPKSRAVSVSQHKSCKSTNQSQRVLFQKKYKYKARNRNKYVDPAVLINKLEREKAKIEGRKAKTISIPKSVKQQLRKEREKKQKKNKTNPLITQQQRHETKMANSELIFQPLVQIKRIQSKRRKKKEEANEDNEPNDDDRNGINATAYLYPQRLASNDSSSFVNQYKDDLLLKITLYPKYREINIAKGKRLNIRQTKGFKIIDEWFIEERDQRKPFGKITNDYVLIKKWQQNKITVPPNAYSHCDRNIKSNRNALKTFKSNMRRYCGGTHDEQHHATTCANYMFIESVRLNGENGSPPSKVCIQCGLSLQCLPLVRIGEAVVFTTKSNAKYKVYLYYVAMICENYPLCTFPRSRRYFDKHWIKCAWFNDINGKEFNQRNGNKKQTRKRKHYVSSNVAPPHKKQKTQSIPPNVAPVTIDLTTDNTIDLPPAVSLPSPLPLPLPLTLPLPLPPFSLPDTSSLPPLLPLMSLPFVLPPLSLMNNVPNSDNCLALPNLNMNWLNTNDIKLRSESRSPTSPLSTPEACLH